MTPDWRPHVDRFRTPKTSRAAFEVGVTVVAIVAVWPLLVWSYDVSVALLAPLMLVYAGLLVRLFVLQHDCGHGALFPTRRQNDVVGMVLCVPLLTPYHEWTKSHALHHRGSSHLGRRSKGDIYVMTVDEWRAASRFDRFRYWFRRNPLFLLPLAPIVVFLFKHRVKGSMCEELPRGRNFWNVHLTTLAAALLLWGLAALVGWQKVLVVHGLCLWVAGAVGVWLFYMQHQFESAWWADDDGYDFDRAGLQGSSYYDLHPVLHWFTGNIGFHHIHHLDPRVPLYRLPQCHRSTTMFDGVPTLTLWQSFATARLKLWDGQKLVPFPSDDDVGEPERQSNL